MKKNKIRLSFILLIGFLFFQFLFSLKFKEPYPAIKFPGFGGIPQTSGKIKYTKYEVLAYSSDQHYDLINSAELFNNLPPVFIPGLLNLIIKKHNKNSSKDQQAYNDFKAIVFSRLHNINKKNYHKLEIRKLEVVRNPTINNSPENASLQEKAEIIL